MKPNGLSATLLSAAIVLSLASCRLPEGATPADKRQEVERMCQEALDILYQARPESKAFIENAQGYAVFSSLAAKIFLVGTGNGYGVLVDNETGKKTYMRMLQGGVGFGMGIKDFRAVFVFTQRLAMERFGDNGWSFKGDADAAAAYDGEGLTAGATANLGQGVFLYQLTEAGLALQAMVAGTKYWRYDELNDS